MGVDWSPCNVCGIWWWHETGSKHTCPPKWLVFIEDLHTKEPSDEERDWWMVYAVDEESAVEKFAEKFSSDADYCLLNEAYPAWVRPFPWNANDVPVKFTVEGEQTITYTAERVS